MNKYPINSTVIINSSFSNSKEPFCAGMMKYIGKEATILDYTYSARDMCGWYTLDVDDGAYCWMREMLNVTHIGTFNDSMEMPENIYNLTVDDVKGLIGTYRDFMKGEKMSSNLGKTIKQQNDIWESITGKKYYIEYEKDKGFTQTFTGYLENFNGSGTSTFFNDETDECLMIKTSWIIYMKMRKS